MGKKIQKRYNFLQTGVKRGMECGKMKKFIKKNDSFFCWFQQKKDLEGGKVGVVPGWA